MADFTLSVGIDVGLSFDQMQKDISSLVSQLNGNPPKIKVGLEIDKAALSDFKNQISNLNKSSNGSNIKVGTGNVNTGAKSAAADMATVAKNARDAATALKSTDSAFKNTSAGAKTLTVGTTEYYTALKQVNTLLNQVTNSQEKWTAAKTGKSRAAYNDLGTYANELRSLQQQLQSGSITVDDFKNRLASIRTGVTSASSAIKSAGEATQTWSERISSLSAKFGTWLSITQVIMAGVRTIKAMASNVVELDTAMTELRKVTDESEASYDRFLERATTRSKELGAALSDTVTATADFARLGYGISEAEKLADAAIVYKNVGDGVEDISTASESIISTMQAFGVPAEQAMNIVDKFNEVGNKYAISSKGVGDALLRSAAAMKSAGNTIDQAIALATAANTIVQDPDKVGTALKTVSMRLRGAETELEEAGLETDGMAKSVSTLREELLALTGGKVDIQLDNDTFKSTYEMLKELSAVWDELTDVSRANILERVAGKNQSNVVAALLENFSIAEQALATSADSAGSAVRENEKALESIEGRMQILKATFQEFSSTMISDNFLKGLISTGTTVLEIINNIVTSLGGLGSTIGIVGGFIVALNLTSVIRKLKSLFETIQIFAMLKWDSIFNSSFVKGLQAIPAGLKALTTGSQAAATAFKMLGGASSVATVGLTALVAIIGIATIAYQKHKQAQEEARKKTLEEANAVVENTNTLRDAYVTYMQYANRNNLTTSEESAFASAIDQVTQSLGAKASALEGVTAGTQGYTEAVKQATKADLKQAVIEAKKAKQAAKDTLQDTSWGWGGDTTIGVGIKSGSAGIHWGFNQNAYDTAKKVMGDYVTNKVQSGLTTSSSEYLMPKNWTNNHQDMDKVVDYYYKLIELQNTLAQENNTNNDLYKDANAVTGKLKDSVEDYVKKKYEELSLTYQLNNGIPTTIEEFKKYRDYLNTELGDDFIFDDGNKQLSQIIDGYLSTTKTYADYITKLADTSQQVSAVEAKISETKETFANSSAAIKKEAEDLGIDLSQTTFGNIDTNNRQVLEWTDENIAKYKSALESWEASAEEMKGSISTVFGSSDEFDGVEIAFSPMLQTENGAVLLDKDTVYSYINGLIEKAGESWTNEDLFRLDTEGLEIDGQLIKGLIADIGETAIKTGEAMHFTGENGAVKEAEKEVQEFNNWIDGLSDSDKEIVYNISVTKDTAEWSLEQWREDLNNLKSDSQALDILKSKVQAIKDVARGTISFDIDSENSGIDSLHSAMGESISAVGLTADAISKIQSRYSQLSSFNAAELFEKTANGIHLNSDALRELDAEYEAVQRTYLDTALDEQVEKYNNLSEKIAECTDVQKRAKLIAEQNTLGEQIEQTAVLAAQYDGLTSAYQKWMDAQSGGEEGDMYDSVADNLEKAKELYDKGLVGTNEFRAAAQMMTNYDISDWGIEDVMKAYKNGYPLMKRYFTDGQEGCQRFLSDVSKLNSEWVNMNEDGSWEIDFGAGNDQEIADKLGISVDAVQSILRKLSDYGYDINLDSVFGDLGLLEDKLSSANEKLKELGYTKVDFNFNSDSVKDVDNQIKQATDVLNKFKNSDGTVNLSLDGATEAQTILTALILKKQELNSPAVMSVDTTHAQSDVENVIAALQNFQSNYNKLEVDTAIGVDTTEAQTRVDAAMATISASNPEILASLCIDPTSKETLKSTIGALSSEVMIKAGVDETLIKGYQATEHNSKGAVKWDNDTFLVDSWIAQSHIASGTIKWGNDEKNVKKHFTASGTINWSGSAGARGTAFKDGNWGAKKSGMALGGELGRELVVRNGKFFTIGDDGAEFFNYQKGDIIFNADQTEQIFSKGKITHGNRRGKAFYTGTAFANGSDKPEKIDWIEIFSNRVESNIKKFTNGFKNLYTTLTNRFSNLSNAVTETQNQIRFKQQAYDRYMEQAKSVGLDESWAAKIRDGELDISSVSDETLKEKINDYKEWYEKAIDCKEAIDGLHTSISDLYKDNFDNIEKAYDNILTSIEHKAKNINNYIDRAEEQGLVGSTRYYTALQSIENENLQQLEYKRNDLTSTLNDAINNGEIEVYSESWYELRNSIDEVTEAIDESKTALIKYDNEMRQILWDRFDYFNDTISQFKDESDFLIDLLDGDDLYDENGMLSDKGLSTLGLHGLNYNTLMSQSSSYAKEIAKINRDIANNPGDDNLIQRKQELLKLQRDSVLAAKDEKEAMIDLVKNGVEKETDALKDLIDKYNDSLDSAKDLYDYQNKIKEHTKDTASIEKQLSAYQNDTSEEAKATVQKLKNDLKEAQQDLKDTEYDRYVSDQKELLDNLYTEYDNLMNTRLDNIDASFEDLIDKINSNSATINTTLSKESSAVGISLSDEMRSVWTSQSTALSKYFSNGGIVLNNISGYFENTNGALTGINTVLNEIKDGVNNVVKYASYQAKVNIDPEGSKNQMIQNSLDWFATDDSAAKSSLESDNEAYGKAFGYTKKDGSWYDNSSNLVYSVSDDDKIRNIVSKMKANSSAWGNASESERIRLSNANVSYANKIRNLTNESVYKDNNGVWWIGDKELYSYKTGGLADFTGTAWLDGTPNKPELVLNSQDTKNFIALKDALSKMAKQGISIENMAYGSLGKVPQLSGLTDISSMLLSLRQSESTNASKSIGDISITIPIEHVDDYNDFISQLQKDKQFEKFVRSVSIDLLNGGSTLAKNRYKW